MEDYRDRLKIFMDKLGIKPAYFVENGLFVNGHINKLLKKQMHIGVDKLEIILTHFNELNPRWLIIGDGEMQSTIEAMNNPKVRADQKVLLDGLISVSQAKNEFSKHIEDLRYTIEFQKKEISRLERELSASSMLK
jgi:hypothetical protein